LSSLVSDLKHALRGLVRAPGVTIPIVLCLMLGLGANTAMLSVLDALLVRSPAHVRNANSVVRLYRREHGVLVPQSTFSFPLYSDLASHMQSFAGLAASFRMEGSLGRGRDARRARIGIVSPSFFSVLGVQPVLGRPFLEAEGHPEQPGTVALVSWELWQRAFSGTPEILGRALPIGGQIYTVIGVLPPRFTGIDLERVDVWLPLGAVESLFAGSGWSSQRTSFLLNVVGRLRVGVSLSRAASEASLVLQRQAAELGERWAGEQSVTVSPVQWGHTPEGAHAARLATWLAAASGAVFLIACANVASLLIVRGLGRQRELALRSALGAKRSQIARFVLLESVLLAGLGAVAAYVALQTAGAVLARFLLPEATAPPASLDPRLLAILATLALGAGLLGGLSPAVWGSRPDLYQELRFGARTTSSTLWFVRSALVGAQIAFTCTLLIGAGLFAKSLQHLSRLRMGLDPECVLVVTANLGSTGYGPREVDAFFRRSLERVRRIPGVERASLAAGVPFRSSFGVALVVPGRGEVSGLAPEGIYMNAVSEDFFATLGTRLLQGRPFTVSDDGGMERVAVVNEALAQRLWPGRTPLGQCIQVPDAQAPCISVVGVVESARRARLLEAPTPQLYVPLGQDPLGLTSRALFVRTAGDPGQFASPLRKEIQALAPNLPFIEVRRLSELLDPQLRPWRLGTTLFSLFALLGLALSLVGVFSSIAYSVASRTAELGIRQALGARPGHLLWLVLRSGLGPAVLGVVLGVFLAVWAGGRLEPFLFGVLPRDPEVMAGAALVLLATAFVASLVPALRILRIAPIAALRQE
jgi:predicted permease